LILKPRQHARAFDTHGLVEKGDYKECHCKGYEDVARPNGDGAASASPYAHVEWVRSLRLAFLAFH
jgi:hypothetical protein